MAMTDQQQNFVSEVMQTAEEIIKMNNKLDQLIARWNLNDFTTNLNNGDFGAIPSLAHLNKTKFTAAITAFQAIQTALGDKTSGQITNLIKLKG